MFASLYIDIVFYSADNSQFIVKCTELLHKCTAIKLLYCWQHCHHSYHLQMIFHKSSLSSSNYHHNSILECSAHPNRASSSSRFLSSKSWSSATNKDTLSISRCTHAAQESAPPRGQLLAHAPSQNSGFLHHNNILTLLLFFCVHSNTPQVSHTTILFFALE